jgi:hypothetical protein
MSGILSWTLIIYIYAGAMAQGDSVTVTATPMATQEICETAGTALDSLVSGSTKVVRYVCVKNQ